MYIWINVFVKGNYIKKGEDGINDGLSLKISEEKNIVGKKYVL